MECMYTYEGCTRTGCTFRGVSCGRDSGDEGYRGASTKEILVQPSSSRRVLLKRREISSRHSWSSDNASFELGRGGGCISHCRRLLRRATAAREVERWHGRSAQIAEGVWNPRYPSSSCSGFGVGCCRRSPLCGSAGPCCCLSASSPRTSSIIAVLIPRIHCRTTESPRQYKARAAPDSSPGRCW